MEWMQNDFFLNAVITSLLLSVVSAPLGVFLTLKRMSLMGDAISHSLLPGMALSLMIFGFSTVGLFIGGLVAGIFVLFLMFWISQKPVFKDDSILALIYLTMSSLGILLISKANVKIDLMHFLFGNILLVPKDWIYMIAVSTGLIFLVFLKIKSRLIQLIVDPEYSRFLQISESKIKNTFYFLVLWVLILSFYSVGTMLALGFLIIPAMLAKQFTRSINRQIILSVVFGFIISLGGISLSFIWDFPTGPTIILFGGILFLLLLSISVLKGHFKKFLIVCLLVVFSLSGKAQTKESVPAQVKSKLVFSIPLLQLIAQELTKGLDPSKWEFVSLITNEQSIHQNAVRPSDIEKFKYSSVIFLIGLGFENFETKWLQSKFKSTKIVVLSERLPFLLPADPHLWNHPLNIVELAQKISLEMIRLQVLDAKAINDNFLKIKNEFNQLHEKYSLLFKNLKNKKIIVSHNSFGYLTLAYNLEIFSPMGFASSEQGKPSDLIRIKKLLMQNLEIPLFKEISSNNVFIEQLAKELKLEIAGTLNGESFLFDLQSKKSLLKVMESNLELIYKSLAPKI